MHSPPVYHSRFGRRGAARCALTEFCLFTCLAMTGMLCPAVQAQERLAVAEEMEASLQEELLEVWYPRVVDTVYGGFLSTFDYRWQPEGAQDKMIVTQARHVWTAAKVAAFYPGDRARYLPVAAHGFAFLRDVMWDAQQGGFFDLVTREGVVREEPEGGILKRAYGNAFAIYGLAAYYAASGDTAALRLAQEAFRWLDGHSHDPVHGGYFQFMQRDGTPLIHGYDGYPPKDQNSSIHLLEAFTELYHVWPDSVLRERLHEMLLLIRDTMVDPDGYLRLFFAADWTPVSYRDSTAVVREQNYGLDHVSFGHDVETGFLMLEASEALELEHDTTTRQMARKMVDHALENGWDMAIGGLYDEGYYFAGADAPAIIKDTKTWWSQAEGLNALLVMAHLFPEERAWYFGHFLQLWEYIKAYLIDHEHGGWYGGGLDKEPHFRTAHKAHIWKAAYHDGRALMACIRRLRASDMARPRRSPEAKRTH